MIADNGSKAETFEVLQLSTIDNIFKLRPTNRT